MEDEGPITKLNVSTSKDEEEILRAHGYQHINADLNDGTGKNRVFIWYKKECGNRPVTRIQFSFNDGMKSVLADAWYELVNRDLNRGAGGDDIFLWYFCGSTEHDIPIVDLKVSKDAKEEPALLQDGWERLGCDLNRKAGGNFIYLWVKREKPSYICEITASVDFSCDRYLFEQGYTRVDEDTNRGAGGKHVFLWYRRSTDKSKALTALNVSTSPQEQAKLQASGFKMVCVDLSEGAGGKYVYTWYKKEGCESQIQAMVLLINPDAWKEYQKAGINFVEKNLNEDNKGWKMYITYK
ncbi:uncharacterized protein LOC127157096 [Labeo rohita]|uniref:uncharacterized protein LOC127157096 n=1 Tax=Labeo rohita TaxID=84645 RepID=UPI0021E31626|nr:uncharacterized protein LOC127157096 [Labeo rohita]XP_050956300.1 uncharacterized protein LOC127157096 [Labeo rohita]XP_050956309.1 uncharacterized protein LOC127157096 [Labeo rohita]XP_050956317.1 uncharacterized protein LOC127157096 [Labeo rohita]